MEKAQQNASLTSRLVPDNYS